MELLTKKFLAGRRVQGTNADRIPISAVGQGTSYGTDTRPRGNNQGIDFDGTDDVLVIGDKTDWTFLHDGSSWSIRIRLLPDTQTNGRTIINTNGDGGNDRGLQIQALGDGNIRARFSNGSANNVTMATTSTYLTNGSWSDIVVTYNGTAINLYKDGGTNFTANNVSTAFSKEPPKTDLVLGARSTDFAAYIYDGAMDELGIWKDRVLTSAEATELYNSNTPKQCSIFSDKLLLYLDFHVDFAGKVNDSWLDNKAQMDSKTFEEIDYGGRTSIDSTYKIHTFTSSSNFVISAGGGEVEYLVVGGGGGGGVAHGASGNSGGGGGGGAFRTGSLGLSSTSGSSGTHTVTVGPVGTGATWTSASSSTHGGYGGDSVFDSITAEGGGVGGTAQGANTAVPNTKNGSGGGGAGWSAIVAGADGGAYGNKGGTGNVTGVYGSGGGGGAGKGGIKGSEYGHGDGGDGAYSDIIGKNIHYAAGGGGGLYSGGVTNKALGGIGGGGDGGYPESTSTRVGLNGTTNTGSGGGGGSLYSSVGGNGGNGGTGIVIVRYLTSSGIIASGGTITYTTTRIKVT